MPGPRGLRQQSSSLHGNETVVKIKTNSLAGSLESFPWSPSMHSFTEPHRKVALKIS